MNPIDIENIKESSTWKAFEYYVRQKASELDTLDGITFTDPTAGCIEGRARQLAKEKIAQILQPFVSSIGVDKNKIEETAINAGL